MKRILIIGMTNKLGGVETFIYNTVINSDKMKVKFDFLIHGCEECVYQKEIEKFYDGEVFFYFIPSYKKSPIKCIHALREFYDKHGNKYDVIHLQTGAASEIFYIYPFIKKEKMMIVVHSHASSCYHPFENIFSRFFVNHIVNKRLACSKTASQWLFGRKKGKEAKIVINGIDNMRFQYTEDSRSKIRKQYNIPLDSFVVGHVGRFSVEKNHPFIIDIFSNILLRNNNAILILVGDGEDKDKIKKICQEKNILSSVRFVGIQTETAPYYSAFDVFLMPSIYEGLPLVGIEAQASGLPCFFSENIDSQILISDRSKMYPLTMEASEWAKEIMISICANVDRRSYSDIIHKKGYSIQKTIEELEEVYDV